MASSFEAGGAHLRRAVAALESDASFAGGAQSALEEALAAVGAVAAALFTVADGGARSCVARAGRPGPGQAPGLDVALPEAPVFDSGTPDASAVLPLRTHGAPAGVLVFRYAGPRVFSEAERDFLETLAGVCTLALQRAQQAERATALLAEERARLLQKAELASREAQEQREWLISILMQAPVAIALYRGPEHVIELVNPLMCRIWGRAAHEVVGKTVASALPEMKAQGVIQVALDPVFETGQPFFANEMPVKVDRMGNGELTEGHYNFVHVPLRKHGVTEGIVAVASEVSDQVRARRQMEKLTQGLRDSEAQFRTLADSIPQLAWIAEADGSIGWYNRRWYEFTGTTPEQMAEQEGWGWQRVHDPLELPRVIGRFRQAVESGEPWEDTFPLRRYDGQLRAHLSRAMPVRDAAGRVVRWFGTNTDVEDQRRMATELKEALQLRDDFLSIAGHELRTPLAAMLMHVQSLQRSQARGAGSPRVVERLGKAAAAGVRLEKLINQLLDVSRIQAGRMRLEPRPLDLVELTREVLERSADLAASQKTKVTLQAPVTLVGSWDRDLLDQVVTNLVSNALKYGQGKPVEVGVSAHASEARLTVRDFGIGIAPEAQRRIFQRFERAALSTDYGGIGLGLWISRRIVEASGGRIEVASTPGEGSKFTVTLPLHSEENRHADG